VLVDEAVGARSPLVAPLGRALRARAANVKRLDLRAGEALQDARGIERTTEWLAEEGYDRRGAVVGGAAARPPITRGSRGGGLYLRGVRFASCRRRSAIVDASVGGKTAVDLPAGKTSWSVHQPRPSSPIWLPRHAAGA